MDYSKENQNWDSLSYVEKNHQLYLKQKALLDQFLEKGAISQAQHDSMMLYKLFCTPLGSNNKGNKKVL